MARTHKPTSLKIVEGNRGKRSTNKQEPDPEYLNDLAAPSFLTKEAAQVWDEIVPDLRKAKLLTKIDIPMLSLGCEALARYRKLTAEIDVDCKSIGSEEEKKDKWMATTIQSMSFKQAMAVMQQFGMSPAARTRIAIQPQGDLFGETGSNYFT
ncbi:MAG: phage terminase small subunit P27 family [Nitrosomonas sp.]|nr:phage terminase small subunit P27 family [Nitrosomonas sp.]